MKKLITLLILTLTGSFIVCSANPLSSESLLSNSNAEVYAYQYMEELNNQANDTILDKEILAFLARYPDSNFTPYVTFFKGNISLRKGDYLSAQNIYKSLIHESLSQSVYAELLLNYAISLSYTADYGQAMYLLQQVDSEMSDPLILAEANKIRGDIYYQQGQYYSAEARYQEALKAAPKDTDIALALFTTLVKLRKDDDAISLLAAQDTASALYPNFAFCWLEYLLENERYKDFDAFIHNYDLGKAKGTTNLLEIRIRRALLVSDYDTAASLLKQSKVKESSFLYYSSIIELHEGNTVLADSTLSSLIDDKNPEIAVSAYLERLKLIYKSNPEDATNQLLQYARDSSSPVKKAEVYYTLGYFFYHMNNYSEALRQLSYSKQFDMNSELSARVEILLAESWFAANRLDVAQETFNRYLNMFPLGSARDRAWFHVGFIYFNQKDYVHSKTCFDELLRFHPDSAYANDAVYYLAEMDFFLANYNLALNGYLKLFKQTVNDSPVTLRIAQVYYYLGSYELCEEYLALLVPSYEMCILKGSLNIAKKNYAVALDQFILAENFATERIRKVEAQSYRALSLYQLKRYREASELYLQLSSEKESPDTYLFLSAKSSYAAKDYHLALQLYDSFIDTHPESIHFLVAMSDVANIYYNMGNYGKAITDWLNILKRFRNTKQFTDSDRDVIRNSIVGLELGLKRSNTEDYFDELLTLPDTFQSSFITFELYYLIIKLYADANEWEQLINTAEKVRTEFPETVSDHVEMMMVDGLIFLSQYSQADSMLASIHSRNGSDEALLKWAELEMLTQNYSLALEKYWQSFRQIPLANTWIKLLECSEKDSYNGFEEIWSAGDSYKADYPQASIIRLNYLYYMALYDEALQWAETILNQSLAVHHHAQAFLTMGMIDFKLEDYPSAIGTLKRVYSLFPEFPDIRRAAAYHIIKSMIQTSQLTEASMHLTNYAVDLNQQQRLELNQLLER